MDEPSSSSSLSRFTPPVYPIPLSAARRCGRSSRNGTPAAFLGVGVAPLHSGELRHGGSRASDTASNKGRRRRPGGVQATQQNTCSVESCCLSTCAGEAHALGVAGWHCRTESGCSRRWSAYVWAGEAGALIFIIAACGLI